LGLLLEEGFVVPELEGVEALLLEERVGGADGLRHDHAVHDCASEERVVDLVLHHLVLQVEARVLELLLHFVLLWV